MILFFFAAVLLSLFCYSMILQHLQYFTQSFQQKCLKQFSEIQIPQKTQISDLFSIDFILLSARAKLIVLTSNGSLSVMKILEQLSQLPFSRRKLVLLDCLSGIQFVFVVLLLFLLGKVNPWLILFVSLICYFIFTNEKARNLFKVFIYSALFLFFSYEFGLKFAQSLQMFFIENPSLMFVSSNNLTAMIFWLVFALVISFILRIDDWSLVFAYLLLLTGMISLSSGLAILAGELLSRSWRFHLIRKKNQMNYYELKSRHGKLSKVLNYPMVWQFIAVVIALGVATDFSVFNPLQLEISAMSQTKTDLFLVSSIVSMMVYWLITMTYGHFAAAEK